MPSVLAVVWRSSWVSGLSATNLHVKSRCVLLNCKLRSENWACESG